MKKIKIIFSILIILSMEITAFATSANTEKTIDDIKEQFQDVSKEDVPEGVIPVRYDSLDEAAKYIQKNIVASQEKM